MGVLINRIFKKIVKNKKGMATVEASLIIPIILFLIFLFIFMAIYVYQQVCVQATVSKAAKKGAAIYSVTKKEMFSGYASRESLSNNDPYWRIMDDKKEKETRVAKYISDMAVNNMDVKKADSKGVIISDGSGNGGVSVRCDSNIVGNKLAVTVEKRYLTGLGGMFKIFGLGSVFTFSCTAEATVSDTTEFVRTLDLTKDIIYEASKTDAGRKVTAVIDNLKGRIQKYLDYLGKGKTKGSNSGNTAKPTTDPVTKPADNKKKTINITGDAELDKWAEKMPAIPGYIDVIAHGNGQTFRVKGVNQDISIKDFSKYMDNKFKQLGIKEKDRKVRLISCNAAEGDAAQTIANKCNAQVLAPNKKLHFYEDGTMTIGTEENPTNGEWVNVSPTRYDPKNPPPKVVPTKKK